MALATFALFSPAALCGFVNYDDDAYVTENAALRGGLTPDAARWAITAYHSGNWHPLTWLSHALDISLFGFAPAGHHLVNVALHALNAALVFGLLARYLGARAPALAAAALFAAHPLRVESVAWVAERKDLLCAFFFLMLLLAYDQAQRSSRRVAWCFAGLPFLYALALMSKPMAITAPFLLLVLDVFLYRRLQGDSLVARLRCSSLLAAEKTILWLMCLGSAWVTIQAQRTALASVDALPIGLRLANAVRAYGWYVEKTLLPLDLCVLYPFNASDITPVSVLRGVIVLAALLFVCLWTRNRRQWVGLLWFLGTLVPVIGLVQVGQQAYADRYSYLPTIGLLWMLGEALRPLSRARVVASTAVAIVLACLTLAQLRYWRDSETLFSRALAVDPNNVPAHLNLGTYYFEKNDLATAKREFQSALQIKPASFDAQYNLGALLLAEGDAAGALAPLEQAVEQQPSHGEAQNNLGMALLQLNRTAEAGPHLADAVRLSPNNAAAHANVGVYLLRMGDKAKAAAEFQTALKLDPNNATIQKNLALCR